jgi:hypothetical protein
MRHDDLQLRGDMLHDYLGRDLHEPGSPVVLLHTVARDDRFLVHASGVLGSGAQPMRPSFAAAVIAATCTAGAQAHAQATPSAWSPQSNANGCNDGKGCHSAIVASALLGAVPTVTVGIELTAGANVRLGTPVRILLMALGAASLATGLWDGYAYRSEGPGSYLPGPITGSLLGGGSIITNLVLMATPRVHAPTTNMSRWSPTAIVMSDAAGHPTLGPGVTGVMY